jgi:outer membrane protein assembly factor BamB
VGPGGTLYYTIPTGGVFAFDLMGNPLWAKSFTGLVQSQDPVVGDDDRVFFISNSGQRVICLTSTGDKLWSYDMQPDRFANFPSLGYDNDLYITIENNGDYIAYRRLDGDTGTLTIAIQAIGLRGYLSHGTHMDKAYVQRTDPINQGTCCDDFFVSRASDDNTINWFLNTPGVTQIGAYPVVTPQNDIYVQGPDGMYVVVF